MDRKWKLLFRNESWEFPKIGSTFLGSLIRIVVVFGGICRVPLFVETTPSLSYLPCLDGA